MSNLELPEGTEKRGVVQYGWTPPPGSPVEVEPGKPWQGVKKSAGNLTDDELDDDLTKRLAEEARKRLKK